MRKKKSLLRKRERGLVGVYKHIEIAIVVVMSTFVYALFSTASPMVLKVDAIPNGAKLASLHLLNEGDVESEIHLDKLIKLLLLEEQTPEGQLRVVASIYEYQESNGYVNLATPTLITSYNVPAEVKFIDSSGMPFKVVVTPEI
ncbi:hypothetical protein ACJJJB_07125 [Microbulbifer sp. ANSA001]|uniref:hypothetical protein n=1 Tax=Microbulbifer sp. ANSA001 TaxID=3243358 RepID=UPI0040437429